ncbi:hypothetical protein [Leptospira licerasiae]
MTKLNFIIPSNLHRFVSQKLLIFCLVFSLGNCERASWIAEDSILSLNGEWEFISDNNTNPDFKKGTKITVPFDFSSDDVYQNFDG